jgi:hypothetical protein
MDLSLRKSAESNRILNPQTVDNPVSTRYPRVMSKITRYGFEFDRSLEDDDGNQVWDDLGIEMWCIKQGEDYLKKHGRSLAFHYENCRRLIWPELDDHRWHRLCRDEVLSSKITVLMGCASSGKSHTPAWICLIAYWCRPNETCVLVSSTTMPSLKKRIWAEISMLWQKGVERYPKLAGHMLDSAVAITTDNIEDVEAGERKVRDMRKGIFGIACVVGGKTVGLSRYVGIKQKWMYLLADEAQMMADGFLSAFANLNNNENFKAVIMGNPNDIMDPLGRASEPKEGWTEEYLEPKKTMCWDTRFMNGRCVNLVGPDSPNFDFPADEPARYKYLISREKIAETLSFFPKDSIEYYSMCLGVMKIGTVARRVLSRDLCKRMGAHEPPKWSSEPRTKVYFVDASYGGDRCVGGWAEIGTDVEGKQILAFDRPKIIPIIVGQGEPEEQIAKFVKIDCEEAGIPGDHMGHDATGRGALGTALARAWSADTHPIDFGGRPTKRPVNADITILDDETKLKRLLRCDEHYDRFVSELWFSVRYAVEAAQVRNLPEDVMEELCARKWDKVKGDKKSVEVKDGTPNKPGFKQRMGYSPDLGDWSVGIVEMARRKGFVIAKLGGASKPTPTDDWFKKMAEKQKGLLQSRQLQSV